MKPYKCLVCRTNSLMKSLNKSLSAFSMRKRWLVTGTAVLLSLLLANPVDAQRTGKKEEAEERKTKQTVAMSQQVYEKLTEIQAFVEAEDMEAALDIARGCPFLDMESATIEVAEMMQM